MKVVSIVEGDGEVTALPVLLRRIAQWRSPGVYAEIAQPIRVRRDRFLNRAEEFERHLLLAARKSGEGDWILVLFDADDDCPAETAAMVLERARRVVPHRRISVVLANREYEAWFIAAAQSLDGHRGFRFDPQETTAAETPRDAKGWMRLRMSAGSYGETTDQPAFSAKMDLAQAFDNSRSFRKLCTEWDRVAAAAA
ncbi:MULTISPECIES: DUF4276 family protein [unclassified Rubrivivax]|uniref:DUF4276 family protein n=1 Tax=unclassified Rubrivivax TaxID=2649762 RepID=UPI0013E90EE5|nr:MULTISPECIES: DUF4276 family protein [unclassified Rubrivivax]MCC9598419.1 DUF4276 family protein [Rubrivivax sp. JA1055]